MVKHRQLARQVGVLGALRSRARWTSRSSFAAGLVGPRRRLATSFESSSSRQSQEDTRLTNVASTSYDAHIGYSTRDSSRKRFRVVYETANYYSAMANKPPKTTPPKIYILGTLGLRQKATAVATSIHQDFHRSKQKNVCASYTQ